jgi:hypothetical protein
MGFRMNQSHQRIPRLFVAVFLVCIMGSLWPRVAGADVAQEEETPMHIYLPAAVLGGANLYSVIGNTAGLATQEPSRAVSYVGIVGGALAIGYAAALASNTVKHENLSVFLGVTGGLALGLGAFNLRLAHHLDELGASEVRLGPTMVSDGAVFVGGIGISIDF